MKKKVRETTDEESEVERVKKAIEIEREEKEERKRER